MTFPIRPDCRKAHPAGIAFLLTLLFMALPVSATERDRFLDIREISAPGGITAWLVEDHSVPVVSVKFAFRGAGSVRDPNGLHGLARLASNTLDEGAGEMDSAAFQGVLRDDSITLNFSSSRDHFYGNLKTLTENLDRAASLMNLALTQPRFDEEAVERMRQANMARIRSSVSNPDWLAARIMNDRAFEGHPYAHNSGGSLSSLAAITAEDLHDFARGKLVRDRLTVAVTGDIDAEGAGALLRKLFDGLPVRGDYPDVAPTPIHNTGTSALYVTDIPQTIIRIMQPGPARSDPDYHAAKLMNYILGGAGFGSRLMEVIREERGLTYGVYTGLMPMDYAQAITLSTSTRNETVQEVMDLIREEWTRMKSEPVSAKELEDARAYLIGSMPLALSSTDAIAGLLLGLQLDNLPITYLDEREWALDNVSAGDILRISQKFLDPEALTIVFVGKPDDTGVTFKYGALPDVK